MIETILKDEFMDYRKVKAALTDCGLSKREIKEEKAVHGVRTVQVNTEEGDIGWLWYIPKNVWNRYLSEK